MKILTDLRLLLLGLWLGAAVFFIGVAQNAFAVIEQRELAGNVVGRDLSLLNYSGLVIGLLLILLSQAGAARSHRFWLWFERFLLLLLAAACAIGQFVIGTWISVIKRQIDGPIDGLAVDDPQRIQFNTLHEYSVWVLLTGMAAALIAFFIIANRRFYDAKAAAADIYDLPKDFKV